MKWLRKTNTVRSKLDLYYIMTGLLLFQEPYTQTSANYL